MNETEAFLWDNVRTLCLDSSSKEYDVTEVSDSLSKLMARIGDDKLPDYVASAIESGLFTFEEGSLLIGVASYSTADEGSRIQRVLEQWLEIGSSELRIALALDHDTIPFRSREHRRRVLTEIATRYPKFAEACRDLVQR